MISAMHEDPLLASVVLRASRIYTRFAPSARAANYAIILLAAAASHLAMAQQTTLQAQISYELAGDRLVPGSTFLLTVRSLWKGDECRLLPGSLLHATVESVLHSQNGHTSQIVFKVDAPCEDREPLHLVVTSLLAPPRTETRLEQFPGFGSLGVGTMSSGNPGNFDGAGAMRGTAQVVTSTTVAVTKLPPTVNLGEVWHLPHIQLVLPTGSGTASAISSSKGRLRLPAGSVFILQTARKRGQPLTAASAITGQRSPAEARPSVHPFVRPCRPADCKVYSDKLPLEPFGFQHIGVDTDLMPFGFKPEHDRDVTELETATTIQFVDAGDVLLTFPTHQLVQRTGTENPTDEPRSIRAILFNTTTRSPTRVLDWIVNDHNPYVWPCGHNLLVHEGQLLKLYRPGLQQIASLPLPGPLASLRVSPDGEHVLLGELHELHSEPDHELLVETQVHGPEEEILWSLLDGQLRPLATLGTSSNFVPAPTLSNAGIIELRKGRDPEWFLVFKPWQGGIDKQLGSLRSACLPVLNGISPALLAIATCDVPGNGMHTFVVREDGSTLFEQLSDDQEMPLSFVASIASPKIAAMLTHTSPEYARGLPFHLGVIEAQTIEVLETGRGNILARLPVPEAAPFREPYALSPDGHTLALVSGHILSFYALQPSPASAATSSEN